MREETKRIPGGSVTDDGKSEGASSTAEAGEPSEGTPSREGASRVTEPRGGKAPGQEAPISVDTKLARIATRARERPQEVITSLNYMIDVEWLREAYRRTRKDGAVGVDGTTAREYEANLDENLASLHERFKSRTYRAPPVKRVHIPKGDGSKTRPIGIPSFEDKVLQRAVSMLLNAIYEQEFRNCSWGFRPRRSQHGALNALRDGVMDMKGGYVIELDIKAFFDSLMHEHLQAFLDLRVRDGVIRQAIGSWLKAGVLENGCFMHSDQGTPQGGVVSPLLANIFLHHVLDQWFEDDIKPRLRGEAFLVRYADDAVIVLYNERDAHNVMNVLPNRFGRYGLTLHSGKTRLVKFTRPPYRKGKCDDEDEPGTFAFLGFTHYWGRTRWNAWAVKVKTEAKRLARTLKAIAAWLKEHRHMAVREQHAALCKKLLGHDGYYGVSGNYAALAALRRGVVRHWRTWLDRRHQRGSMPWERFNLLLARYTLPPPKMRKVLRP